MEMRPSIKTLTFVIEDGNYIPSLFSCLHLKFQPPIKAIFVKRKEAAKQDSWVVSYFEVVTVTNLKYEKSCHFQTRRYVEALL